MSVEKPQLPDGQRSDGVRPAWTVSTPRSGPARSVAILDAVQRQIVERRAVLDQAEDLGAITVVVKLHVGTTTIKSVVYSEERMNRRLPIR